MKLPKLTTEERLDASIDDYIKDQENLEAMQLRRLEETGRMKPSLLDKLTGKKYRLPKKSKSKSKRKIKGCGCK
jgi:hypothetical protein